VVRARRDGRQHRHSRSDLPRPGAV